MSFPPDFLKFTAQARLLGNSKEHLVLILESLQLFLPFNFEIIVLFHSFTPTPHRFSQSILDDIMVSTLAKTVLSTLRHMLLLRNSCLLAKHAVELGTVTIKRLVVGFFVGLYETSPKSCLLLPRYPNISAAVRKRVRFFRGNLLDLGCCPFPVIFNLDCGQEVAPIFMGQGNIVLLMFIQLILHG